jgi:hypothetical protein
MSSAPVTMLHPAAHAPPTAKASTARTTLVVRLVLVAAALVPSFLGSLMLTFAAFDP